MIIFHIIQLIINKINTLLISLDFTDKIIASIRETIIDNNKEIKRIFIGFFKESEIPLIISYLSI